VDKSLGRNYDMFCVVSGWGMGGNRGARRKGSIFTKSDFESTISGHFGV